MNPFLPRPNVREIAVRTDRAPACHQFSTTGEIRLVSRERAPTPHRVFLYTVFMPLKRFLAGRRALVARACWVMSAAAVVAMGCASKTAEPTSGSYVVQFPSTAAAVATDALTLRVYDAPTQDTCQDLVHRVRTRQVVPPVIAEAPRGGPCAPNPIEPLAVGYGNRAFMVVGERQGQELLIGCTVQEVFEGSPQPTISLALIDSGVRVEPTTCVALSDHCAGRC